MITFDTFITFLGWCSVINISMFVFAVIILMTLREPISKIHSKLFGLNEVNLPLTYFNI